MEINLKLCICLSLLLAYASSNVIYLNPGCNHYDPDGSCFSCSKRFYKDD